METILDQSDIDSIYRNYPWATEETLRLIYMYTTRDDSKLDVELKRIIDEIKRTGQHTADANEDIRQILGITKGATDATSAALKVAMNNTDDAVGGMVDMVNVLGEGGGALGGGISAFGDALGDLAGKKGWNKIFKTMGGIIEGGGALIGTTSIVAAAAAAKGLQLAAQADADLKLAINMGGVETNLDAYTDLRVLSTNLGLSFQEMLNTTSSAKSIMTKFGSSMIDGTTNFGLFAERLRYDKEFSKMGYNTAQFMQRLVDETEILHGVSNFEKLDDAAQKAISDSFLASSRIATLLAVATGDNRDRLLEQRKEFMTNLDFQTSVRRRIDRDSRFDTPEKKKQLEEHAAWMMSIIPNFVPERLAGAAQEIMMANYANTGTSDSAFEELFKHPEFHDYITSIASVAPDAAEELMQMLSVPTGELVDSEEKVKALLVKINTAYANIDRESLSTDQASQDIREAAARAKLAQDRIANLKKASIEELDAALDSADDGIMAVDDAKITFTKAMEKFKPGYDDLSGGLKVFTDSLYKLLGLETPEAAARRMADAYNKVLTKVSDKDSTLYSALHSLRYSEQWLADPENENAPIMDRAKHEKTVRMNRQAIQKEFDPKVLAAMGITDIEDISLLSDLAENNQTYTAKDGYIVIENDTTRENNTQIERDIRNGNELVRDNATGGVVRDPSSEEMRKNAQARIAHAMNFFMNKHGWTAEQAAGLVGNLQVESYAWLDHTAVGDGGQAYGIAQWHPARQKDFKRLFKKPIQGSTFEEQLSFVQWELENTHKGAGDNLRNATTAGDAAYIVDTQYEKSARLHTDLRINSARRLVLGDYSQTEASDVDQNDQSTSDKTPTSQLNSLLLKLEVYENITNKNEADKLAIKELKEKIKILQEQLNSQPSNNQPTINPELGSNTVLYPNTNNSVPHVYEFPEEYFQDDTTYVASYNAFDWSSGVSDLNEINETLNKHTHNVSMGELV